jgi:prepilin-type N-terminal cleavage/methylation domain-containing protein
MRRGFTLLEAVLALAITALVLAALQGTVGLAAQARARATRVAEREGAARALLVGLAAELEAALAPLAPGGDDRFVVRAPDPGQPWSTLRFATLGRGTDVGRLVAYGVEHGTLVRREVGSFAAPHTSEPPGVPLLDAVDRFRVRCFDGGAWRPVWNAPALPRAVELTLATGGGAEFITSVTLAVEGGS